MCGITGILHFDPVRGVDDASLTAMTRALAHRGPDGEHVFVEGALGFGHRRLAIIDPSERGRQPMRSGCARFVIVFNGAIYNYVELREELQGRGCTFQSMTDTEVLLELYARDGAACLERLNGMFAFAIWDRAERTLFAARDRLGIKPFYFTVADNSFYFASEIKALIAGRAVTPEVDREGLADYLTFQFCLGGKTLFRSVRQLPPGETLTLRAGTVTTRRYWDLDFTVDESRPATEITASLRELLQDAARLQLRSDVPLGAHLSGGLDSTTVCALAAHAVTGRLQTFTGAFREGDAFDETAWARLAADAFGADPHEVYPTAADFVDFLPRLVYHMDEPAAGPGLFPQYAVSQLASRHVKVVLGGQGGDELFGGYTRYLIAYLEECIRGGIEGTQEQAAYVVTFDTIVRNLPQINGYQPLLRHFWKDGVFESRDQRYFRLIDRSHDVAGQVSPEAFTAGSYLPSEAYRAIFNDGHSSSYINQMTRFDLKTLLPALLHVEDRTSMAASIESRVPLLDHRVVELTARLSPMLKYAGGHSKHILRDAMTGLVPNAILARRDKKGFPVPLDQWYRRPPVREFVADTMGSAASRQRGLFEASALDRLLDAERPYGRGLWGLLCLEIWLETFIDTAV